MPSETCLPSPKTDFKYDKEIRNYQKSLRCSSLSKDYFSGSIEKSHQRKSMQDALMDMNYSRSIFASNKKLDFERQKSVFPEEMNLHSTITKKNASIKTVSDFSLKKNMKVEFDLKRTNFQSGNMKMSPIIKADMLGSPLKTDFSTLQKQLPSDKINDLIAMIEREPSSSFRNLPNA